MNGHFVLAFVVMPALVVALGYAAMRLNEWDLSRDRRKTPTE